MKRIRKTEDYLPCNLGDMPEADGLEWMGKIFLPNTRIAVLVFISKNRVAFRKQWKLLTGNSIGYFCGGAVQCMDRLCEQIEGDGKIGSHVEVEPHYFCVMGFSAPDININIIAHESVHAAFAFANRFRPDPKWQYGVEEVPEEQVCYVAGEITEVLAGIFEDRGFLKKSFK